MRKMTSLILLGVSASMPAQSTSRPTMTAVAESLPELVRSGQFQTDSGAAYSRSVDAAMDGSADSIAEAVPACKKNLHSSNSEVRADTMVLLSVMATTEPARTTIANSLVPELTETLLSGDEKLQIATLLVISTLGPLTPDDLVAPLEKLLTERTASSHVAVGAAKELIWIRPNESSTQAAVIHFINNPAVSETTRKEALGETAWNGVGEMIVQNAVRLVAEADSTTMRNAAIFAVGCIGPSAVDRLRARLTKIANDPLESQAARDNAARALSGKGQR